MRTNKAAVLFITLATILIVIILAGVFLRHTSSQARFTHHQVSRIRAYYAARGMMNYAFEQLRNGTWQLPASGARYACHRNCIDSGVTPTYTIPTDNDIPYDIQISIYPKGTGPDGLSAKLEIKTKYTYTP